MAKLLLAILVATLALCNGQFDPETIAFCFSSNRCEAGSLISIGGTVRQCCEQDEEGLSFQTDSEVCSLCVVYGWNTTSFVARERDQPYSVGLVVRKGLGDDLSRLRYGVRLAAGGSATEGDDFVYERRSNIAFTSSELAPLSLTFFLDGVEREGSENFALELVLTEGIQSPISFFNGRLDVIIQDGDPVSVNITIEIEDIVVMEGETREVCVVAIQQDFIRSIPVQIMYIDGTAIESIDYLATTTEVMISPESNFEGCFNLNTINDDLYEFQKEFFLSINTADEDVVINNPNATVLIQDEDSLVIGWEQESYAVSESEAEASVCVTIEGTPEETLPAITVSTEDGTATQGVDYVAVSDGTSIIFSATSPDRICIPVQLIDDLVFESLTPEFFLVELSFPGFDRVEISSQSTQVNITDNEVVSIGFLPVSLNVSEGQGSFSACVTKDQETVERLDVTIVSMAGSAMNGTDFDPSKIPSSIPLEPGETMACFTADDVIINDSFVLEPTVSFTVKIDGVEPFDAARVIIGQDTLEVFILDDDNLTIGFVNEAVEVPENVGFVETCLQASTGEFISTLEVDLVYLSITAQENDDYVPLSRTVTFVRPDTEACFNISIVDDEIHEDVEVFTVRLSPRDSRVMVAQQDFTVTIQDEDSVVIGWEVTTFTVDEGDVEVELCAAILNGSISVGTQVLDVFLPLGSGKAEKGMDYGNDAVPATLEFEPSGPTQLCTRVEIFDDNEIESFEDEDFFVVLRPQLLDDSISIMPDMAQVIIIDNEVVNIGFQDPTVTVGEEATSFTVCLVKNETLEEVEVALSVTEGTANNGTDYLDSEIPQSVVLLPGETTTCFTFPAILDDSLALEPDKSFLLEISDTSPNDPKRIALGIAQVEIVIVDDDNVSIGFVVDSLEVTEDVGTFQVCVDASTTEYEGDIEVTLSYEDGTAQEGSDFTVVDRSLVFTGSSQQECFSVDTVDDLVYEDLEVFSITLSSMNPRVQISQPLLTVTIRDEDNVTFQFVDGIVEVVEDEGLFEVCVVSSTVLMDEIELTLNYDPITAQEGTDFTVVSRSLVFTGSSQRECFSVGAVDDSVYEDLEEMFTISLSSANPRVQFNQSSLIIVIRDEDIVSVEFENADYTSPEDAGFLIVCVTRDIGVATPFTVGVVSTDITATDGIDYLGGTFSITFSAASGGVECLNVTILGDGEPEADETFVLSFVPSSILDPRVQLGAVTNATVTIRDPIIRKNVNDTISGDPVLTVPIFVSEEQLQNIPAEQLSLCYEVHGEGDKWFNLVSDECTSVNALYVGLSERLNIIDDITVKTVDNQQQCINISVSIENGCRAVVGGANLSRYSFGGVSVRTYTNRIRISVPNCNDLTLVMWVLCGEQNFQVVDDLGDTTSVRRNAIKFVVMRGLNYGNRLAHGLLGQFWNVPVSIAPFTGRDIFGDTLENHYVINITTHGDQRSYVGMLSRITWEGEEGPCFYVGDSQSFSIYEVEDPNDGVIQGIYTDYIVSDSFDDSFKFSVFEEDRCN